MKIVRPSIVAALVCAILLLFVTSLSWGQAACPAPSIPPAPCPSDRLCLNWDAVVTNEDGSPFTAAQLPLSYRIWRLIPGPQFLRLPYSTAGLSIGIVGEPRGLQCYAVQAVDKLGRESGLSCYSCKTIRFPGPSDGRIERPTDGGIESSQRSQ
jgi:hypothetical protein